MAWHWDEEVKVRAADLKHSDCFPRAKLPSELEGSDGGIVGIISSLLRFVVEIPKTSVQRGLDFLSVWLVL